MIRPTKTQVVVASGISLDDFASDVPHAPRSAGANAASNAGIIDGVTATALIANADDRGSLSELLTTRDGPIARNANASPAFAVERNDRLNGELMVRAHIGERRVHRRCGLLPLRRDDDGRVPSNHPHSNLHDVGLAHRDIAGSRPSSADYSIWPPCLLRRANGSRADSFEKRF